MKNLTTLIKELQEKAKAATSEPVDTICKGGVNSVNKQIWHMRGHAALEEQAKKDVEFYALCSPENILALVKALEEAKELAEWATESRPTIIGAKARAFLNKHFGEGKE